MSDFYDLCEKEYKTFDGSIKPLYSEDILREVCLGLNSMCIGAESKYFNGYTNINDSEFLVFGVKGLMDTNKKLKDALLFNILSYMSNQLLGKGSTAASIDELYLFLTNNRKVEYAEKQEIQNGIMQKYHPESVFDAPPISEKANCDSKPHGTEQENIFDDAPPLKDKERKRRRGGAPHSQEQSMVPQKSEVKPSESS